MRVSSQKNNTGRPVEVFGKFSKNHLAEQGNRYLKNYECSTKNQENLSGREKRIPTGIIS